jgi:hypothetical protein
MIETAIGAHQIVQHAFAGVTERRMAEIVGERNRFGQIKVQPERLRDAARNLGGFDRVRQAGAVVVALVVDEDLRLVLEPPTYGAVDYAIAVALEAGARRMGRLGRRAAAAGPRAHRIGRQRSRLQFFEILPRPQHSATVRNFIIARAGPRRRSRRSVHKAVGEYIIAPDRRSRE